MVAELALRSLLGASSTKANIIQSNFCSWNCKGPRICNDINLTYGLSKLVLRNTN